MNKQAVFLFIIMILLQGCSRYSIETPSGFASMEKKDRTNFVSPDGVELKISVFPNNPEQDTDFWADDLKTHLEKKGYRHLKTDELEGGRKKEYWIIAYGKEYYIYMTYIYSNRRYIAAAEAAGERNLFEKYSSVIDESLSTLKIR